MACPCCYVLQERLILLLLDSWRNRWLKAEVVATALGTGAGCAALIPGVLGQNNFQWNGHLSTENFAISIIVAALVLSLIMATGLVYVFRPGQLQIPRLGGQQPSLLLSRYRGSYATGGSSEAPRGSGT